MSTPESDPVFWPLLFITLLAAVFVVALVKVIALLVRRDAGHHPQQAQGGGVNIHDASTHHATSIGEIKVKVGRAE